MEKGGRRHGVISIISFLLLLASLLVLPACSDGSNENKKEKDEAASAYEEQLEAQLGLLNEHIPTDERKEALSLLEEINALKEERLKQGEYEKSEKETKLLKQLNEFYDSRTEMYLVEEDQYYEEEPVPEAETLAEYGVGHDGTLDPQGGRSISNECPWTDAQIREVWQQVMDILPEGSDKYFARLEIFTDGHEEMLAYVEQADDTGTLWTLAIDPSDYGDEELFVETIVHEFFHCVTMNDEQVLYTEKPNAFEYTEEYSEGAYCIYPEGSFVADFYEIFWTDYIDDREIDMESEYFYLRHEDDFVTDYAATMPTEDICESFAYFVLYEKDDGGAVWQQKIDFFNDYPKLVEYRQEIRENLGM